MKLLLSATLVVVLWAGVAQSKVNGDLNPKTKKMFRYDPNYENFSEKIGFDTAVVVVGYNRPHYFSEVISALERNPESQSLPFFFILDGGKASTQSEYCDLINQSSIKYKYIIKRPVNFGLHFNIISGLRFLFDWCEFKRIIHFEDDVVVTPQYLGLMLRLDKWAHESYDNIGAVQGFRPCRMSLEEKIKNKAVVAETPGLWLGYCLRKTIWDDIKDIMYEYEKNFLGGAGLETANIQRWMISKIAKGPLKKNIHQSRKWQAPFDPYYTKLPEMGVGQCGMLTTSLFLKGYARLTTLVNRAITIGEEGANYKKEHWYSHFNGVTLEELSDDVSLSFFVSLMKVAY